MDPLSIVVPGAQSLVSAILTDGWTQVRSALARRWSRKNTITQDQAEQRLESGHDASLLVADESANKREILEAYWAGYLAGLAAEHTDLLDAVRELASPPAQSPHSTAVHNSNTGTVGTLLQLGDVHGDISIHDR